MGEIERTKEVYQQAFNDRRRSNKRSMMIGDRNKVLSRKKEHDGKHKKGSQKPQKAAQKPKRELNPNHERRRAVHLPGQRPDRRHHR
jgi:hypothetical protein